MSTNMISGREFMQRDSTMQGAYPVFNLFTPKSASTPREWLTSTQDGFMAVLYNLLAFVGNTARILYHQVMCFRAPKAHATAIAATIGFIGTNIKNIFFNSIKMIPIIGYPISKGIEALAERIYDIGCVNYRMEGVMDLIGDHSFQKAWRPSVSSDLDIKFEDQVSS